MNNHQSTSNFDKLATPPEALEVHLKALTNEAPDLIAKINSIAKFAAQSGENDQLMSRMIYSKRVNYEKEIRNASSV